MKHQIAGLLLLVLIAGCSPSPEQGDSKVITVSIQPQKYLVRQIGGNDWYINVLVPPGSSPETYEPGPLQVKDLAQSAIYFANGYLEFEHGINGKISGLNNQLSIIDLSENLSLIQGDDHHGGTDPHYWLGPQEIKIMAQTIASALQEKDPANKERYTANLSTFLSLMDSLDVKIRKRLAERKRDDFIVFHPALAYFSRQYGLNQLALEEEGKNPSAAHLKSLVDMAREKGIRHLFVQRQFDERNAEALAREIKGELVVFDPLEENLEKNLLYLAEKLSIALN
ncbi:MAG: hypothetical protein FJY10_03535 [Bacteroidetes bacterium]|nr:hypothetical protein [Bacteroidota bacterium]